MLLFYWLLYSAITETRPCDLGLIALLLLGLMYGKLNHYVISIKTNFKASLWLASGYIFKIQKGEIHAKQRSCIKSPTFKFLGGKGCKSKLTM